MATGRKPFVGPPGVGDVLAHLASPATWGRRPSGHILHLPLRPRSGSEVLLVPALRLLRALHRTF